MVKKALLIALSISILMGVCGCTIMKKTYTPDEEKEIVLKYLQDKYHEEFVAESLVGGGWAYSYDEIYLHPKSGKKGEDSFVVHFSGHDDGTYHLSDGYFGIIIQDKYKSTMSGFVKDIYKDFMLNTNVPSDITYADGLNKDTKISEIYDLDNLFLPKTLICVKGSSMQGIDLENSLAGIAKRMLENRLTGRVTVYVVNDDKYELAHKGTYQIDPEKDLMFEPKDIGVNYKLEVFK